MRCEEAEALLGQFAFDELEGDAGKELAAHLRECEGCRRLAEEMRVAARLVREGVQAEAPVLSDERREALLSLAASEGEDAQTSSRAWAFVREQFLARPWLGVAAAYVVFAIGVGILLSVIGPGEEEVGPAAQARLGPVPEALMETAAEVSALETDAGVVFEERAPAREETQAKPRAPTWAKLDRDEDSGAPSPSDSQDAAKPAGKTGIERALDRKVSFEFTDTPLPEAIAQLQRLSGAAIVVDPRAVEGRQTPVNLKASNMSVKLALDWILKLADLDYRLRDGAAFVSTPEALSEDVVLKMYDVRDLAQVIKNFPGPQFDLTFGETAAGDAGSSIVITTEAEEDAVTASSLAETIQSRVKPDSWAAELGTSIEERGGKLVVMQRPEVHARISRKLEELRAQKQALGDNDMLYVVGAIHAGELGSKGAETLAPAPKAVEAGESKAPVPGELPVVGRLFGDEFTGEGGEKPAGAKTSGAEALYEQGVAAYEGLRYEEAKKLFEQAIKARPAHQDAEKMLSDTRALLGYRRDVFLKSMSDLTAEKKVGMQQALVEIRNVLDGARGHYNDAHVPQIGDEERETDAILARQIKDLDEAITRYNRALEVIRWLPYNIDLKEHKDLAIEMRNAATDERMRRLDDLKSFQTRRAALNAEGRRREENKFYEGRVDKLLEQAKRYFEYKQYDSCEKMCKEVLKIDRTSKEAESLIHTARRAKHELLDWRTYTDTVHHRKALKEVSEAAVPLARTMVCPKGWDKIVERVETATAVGMVQERAWEKEIERALEKKVAFEFVETPLSEAVSFLQTLTTVNMILDPRAAEGRETPVNLKASDMSLKLALERILREAGLDYALRDDGICISTPENLAREKGAAAPAFIELTPEEAEALGPDAPEEEAPEEPAPEKEPEAEAEPPEEEAAEAPPVNPFVLTAQDPLSTFAMDVDTASYALARSYIRRGALPPARVVRMEEFVNAFDYNYPHNSREVFSLHAEGAQSPFGKGLHLLKVGVRARDLGREVRKPAHLVFVVDASGSMDRPDRLPLVKAALRMLTGALAPDDLVTLVTYRAQARLLMEAVPASKREEIAATFGALQCGGSTDLLKGLRLGYEMAERHFRPGAVNRVVLCSDGVANVGPTEADEILANVAGYREWGVTLTCAGFGAGGYDDELLERLADSGDGNYVFIDSAREARRVFVEELAATFQTVARDAKVQVEFDPARVRRYRLIGYENRDVPDEQFRDDAVDAGEVGSGQSVTALYELELAPGADGDLGAVYVRYRNVETGKVEETARRLAADAVEDRAVESAPRFYLAAAAAEFAEILRGSEHAADGDLAGVERLLEKVASALPLDARAAELLSLVRAARGPGRAE